MPRWVIDGHRVVALALLMCGPLAWARDGRFDRWEPEVGRVESRNANESPGGVVFYGSSSVRLWALAESFPEADFINAGFGGSEIADCTHFVDRLVMVHRPACVVLYAGDNDLARGRTPHEVCSDFKAFVAAVHADAADCRVVFLSVKPSPARWHHRDAQRQANDLVKEVCGRDDRLTYVDVGGVLLGDDGSPARDLFVADGLHLSPRGYEAWTAIVRTSLADHMPPSRDAAPRLIPVP